MVVQHVLAAIAPGQDVAAEDRSGRHAGMVTRRAARAGSLLVQALSASMSKDRNMAEVQGDGYGCSGAGGA